MQNDETASNAKIKACTGGKHAQKHRKTGSPQPEKNDFDISWPVCNRRFMFIKHQVLVESKTWYFALLPKAI